MAQNPYRFFRGSCFLFYEDLSRENAFPHTAPAVWGCGDLHLENFGSYTAGNRYVYFDQNDFDEATLLPATWEMARMLSSIVVAFKSLGVETDEASDWASLYLDTYCKILRGGKARHLEERLAKGLTRRFLKQADRRTEAELLRRHVTRANGHHRLQTDEKKHFPLRSSKHLLLQYVAQWLPACPVKKLRTYRVVDACHRLAGTGSIGLQRYLLLLEDTQRGDRFLLLDMKEARPSALQPYNPVLQPAWVSEAERVVAIQSRSQYATTAMLCAVDYDGASFTIRELQPEEDKLDFALVLRHEKDVRRVMKDMALLTASAQLRSAGRQGSAIADELIAFGSDRGRQQALLNFGVAYAVQTEKDYQAFLMDFENNVHDERHDLPEN